MTQAATRNERRRAETRRRLTDAAQTLFAEKGYADVAISEITERADVGFGSFYNHFASKQEILDATVEANVEAMGLIIDDVTQGIADPARVMAAGLRAFVRRSYHQPDWVRTTVQAITGSHIAARPLAERARHDLSAGIRTGRFAALPIRETLIVLGGVMCETCRNVASGSLPHTAGDVAAEMMLRMLGIGVEEAAAIAREPLKLYEPPADLELEQTP